MGILGEISESVVRESVPKSTFMQENISKLERTE
jgi:hypothetical protein